MNSLGRSIIHALGFPSYYFNFKWTLASFDMSHLPPVYSSVPRLTLVREEDFMVCTVRGHASFF
jgi:hypothetical protein